jgi:YbgC/YbaW family acyl-CoA thioester hydrolase
MHHTSRIEITVRSTEIDVNGHVNNAKYVEYLEWGREDWYETLGLHHATLLAVGVITVTVNLNVNYRREVKQGQRLWIKTWPVRLGNTSFVVGQEIVDESGGVAVDATVTTVTIDAETRKSRVVPQPLAAAFGANLGQPG